LLLLHHIGNIVSCARGTSVPLVANQKRLEIGKGHIIKTILQTVQDKFRVKCCLKNSEFHFKQPCR
jgi:hypothetical protein